MEEAEDEGLRLQPGVRRQLLSGARSLGFFILEVYVIFLEFSVDANMLSLLSMHNYKKFIPETFNIILIQHLFLKRVTCKMCFLVKTNIHKYLIIRPKAKTFT